MKYLLFHKNIKVLSVNYLADLNEFRDIIEIYNENHLPIGLKQLIQDKNIDALKFWWESRLIPQTRHNLAITNTELDNIIKKSYGFCLSDQYWIKPLNSSMTWETGNFFTNTFNEELGNYISGQINPNNYKHDFHSPDVFTNGEQDKRWVIKNNKRILLKYGQPPYYEQTFNEMLATEICRRLDFNHVQYGFISKGHEKPMIYSTCPCFIDENTEYVPAGFIQYVVKKDKKKSSYDHLIECCKFLEMQNIEEIKKHLAEMTFLDFIIANTDRHFGNFGFIRNAETLEWQGFAPIFDTGNSMFFELPTSDLRRNTSLLQNIKSKSFAKTQKEQLRKFATEILNLNIDFNRLIDIDSYYKTILTQNKKVDEERRELLSQLLLKRIEESKEIIYSRNNITKNFLSLIKNNSDIDFEKKIKLAYQTMAHQSPKNKEIIDIYLRTLKVISPEDLEKKLNKDIVGMKISQIRQSQTDSNGIGGREN